MYGNDVLEIIQLRKGVIKMPEKQIRLYPNPITPNSSILFDEDLCIGCGRCINHCRSDVLMPNPQKGKPPVVAYPDECWFCGCCALACPRHAVMMTFPMNQRAVWRRKDTGKLYRTCVENDLEENTRPPITT